MTFQVPWNTPKPKSNQPTCTRCSNPLPLSLLDTPVVECPFCGYLLNNPYFEPSDEAENTPIPDIKLKWIRGQEWIKFTLAAMFLVLGKRGGGKSNLLEVISVRYPKIIDILGSTDGESLAWCKPEFAKIWKTIHGEEPRILLLHGNTKKVVCRWDTKTIDEITLSTFNDYDVVVLYGGFYGEEVEHFDVMYRLIHMLLYERTYWTEPWYLMIREAADFIYARMKTIKDDKMAKSEFIKLLRQARHAGIAIGVDVIRWTAIDKEGRDIADYTFIKKTGRPNLPDELRWLYRIIKAHSFRTMKSDRFVLVTGEENIALGKCDYAVWHKTEKENILKNLEFQIVDVDGEGIPENQKTYDTSDLEHSQIIETYLQEKSMMKTAQKTERSSRTVNLQISGHNSDITRLGECMRCKRAKSSFGHDIINVPKKKRR